MKYPKLVIPTCDPLFFTEDTFFWTNILSDNFVALVSFFILSCQQIYPHLLIYWHRDITWTGFYRQNYFEHQSKIEKHQKTFLSVDLKTIFIAAEKGQCLFPPI